MTGSARRLRESGEAREGSEVRPDASRSPVSRESVAGTSSSTRVQFLTAVEVLFFFACVLLDIWRWQYTRSHLWILLAAGMVLTHALHRDTWGTLGITRCGIRSSGATVLPIMAALYIPLVVYGFASARLTLLIPNRASILYFLGYGFWCLCQQYMTQSYFHNRLLSVIRNPHLSSALVAVMFGAAHLPNPILTAATTVAGYIFSEIFARHRNIWPLALAQTVGGFLIAAVTPAALIHNMRVGPGYFRWGL